MNEFVNIRLKSFYRTTSIDHRATTAGTGVCVVSMLVGDAQWCCQQTAFCKPFSFCIRGVLINISQVYKDVPTNTCFVVELHNNNGSSITFLIKATTTFRTTSVAHQHRPITSAVL